jgi:rhamnogalacturonan endolyase
MRSHKALSPRTPSLTASLVTVLGAAAILVGCNSTPGTIVQNTTGGSQAPGGTQTQTSGGSTSSGGVVTASGGAATSSGGVATASGGAPTSSGGVVTASGGATGSGGRAAGTGGTPGTGGGTVVGGAPGSGGRTGTAGTTGTGGGTVVGGAPGTGGGTVVGGAPAQGGKASVPLTGHYQMENLDRGVVAVKVAGGVYVGWRMFGYEYTGTDTDTSYNLYKDGTLLKNVTDSTNYLDAAGTTTSKYTVSCVLKGTEGEQSAPVVAWAQQYTSIPLSPPANGPNGGSYSANDASPGDLDGDGKLDIVLKWDPSNSKDNSQSGITDDVFIDGYTLAGKRLWRIDLGPNIRAGAHYTQMSVYDFDGDGKAELAVKTAPGTKDGTGAYLSTGPAASDDDSAVYRNTDGYILTGPEYLTVFAGDTGKELATVAYPVPRGTVSSWGDAYGNRLDRYNGGIAFVKDKGVANGLPSIIQQRGYYTRLTVSALTWRAGTLAQNWIFDSNNAGNSKAAGGGDHSCMAADTDGDGGQEIITGATTIDSAGTFKCSSGMGHGDAMHVGELVKGKGISVFTVHETYGGMDCHDGATCSFYFNITSPGTDTGRGVAEYVSASDLTAATCSGMGNVNCATGAAVSTNAGSDFLIYWNADEPRSTMSGTTLPGVSTTGTASCNSSKATPTLTADLLGDWREEAVLRESSNANLRVYTTVNVTKRRIYTLMHDPTYRAQVAFENSSYNQPPHTGFHIGTGMANPPVPSIHVK